MIVLPTWEMFARFTSMDGYVLAGWLGCCGWFLRWAAAREARALDARRARLLAFCFLLLGLGALCAAQWFAPEGGITIYGGLVGAAWVLGLVNVLAWRRTGKPLL